MALGTFRGPWRLTGSFLFFMAFGAKFVHHIFLFQRTLCFELLDGSRFLWKYWMTYLAITEVFLVLTVGKMNFAPFAALQYYIFGTLVFCCLRNRYRRACDQCDHWNQNQKNLNIQSIQFLIIRPGWSSISNPAQNTGKSADWLLIFQYSIYPVYPC